jgi:hypothetical protein
MTVFAIIAPSFNERLEAAIKEKFPDHWYAIAPGQYLVSADRVTPRQVMERLGIKEASHGRFMILPMASYTGWHVKDLWDWIEAQNTPLTPKAEPDSEQSPLDDGNE